MNISRTTGLLLVITLAGCSARKPVKLVPPATVDALSGWQRAVLDAMSHDPIFPGTNDPKLKRDLAIAYSEGAVLSHYAAVRQSLTNGRAISAIAFETLSLAATTTVPIVNGARGKTILGALATGLTGTQLSIDKNVFKSQTTGAILSAMDTCVSRQRRILTQRRTLSAQEYLLYDAYTDLVNLYGCTTLEGAIQELGETQGAASVAERHVVATVTEVERDNFEDVQKGFLEALKSNRDAAVAFLVAMKASGSPATSSKDEDLISAYRSLALPALTGAPAERASFFSEAKKAGILKK